ncbi:MAG: cupin domain-containing protein [Ignavibacterium sp.]
MENKKEKLTNAVTYQEKSVVSRQIIKKSNGNVTLFAFDEGESLTEHTSPFEALVLMFEGKMTITIGGNPNVIEEGEMILLPPNVPHALFADEKSKMMLTMIK